MTKTFLTVMLLVQVLQDLRLAASMYSDVQLQYSRDELATTENALDSKETTDLSIFSATCPRTPDHQLSQSYSLNRPAPNRQFWQDC